VAVVARPGSARFLGIAAARVPAIGHHARAGSGEVAARPTLIAPQFAEGARWIRDLDAPLLREPQRARRIIRRPRGAGRPPVLGAAGFHATSAGISYPHCSFKELRMRRREFIAVAPG
jgi:hypothetical protein